MIENDLHMDVSSVGRAVARIMKNEFDSEFFKEQIMKENIAFGKSDLPHIGGNRTHVLS